MANTKKQEWIEVGYRFFAKKGPKGLKVELLAREVGKSKSSFYHYFADLEIFMQELFAYHMSRTPILYKAASACQQMDPDFIIAVLEFKEDILFHRELRIHRGLPGCNDCIEQFHHPIEQAFIQIWAEALMLEDKIFLAEAFLRLVIDNFYMRISADKMHYDWLKSYLKEITHTVLGIKKSSVE